MAIYIKSKPEIQQSIYRLGLTQRDFAEKCSISEAYLSDMISGRRSVSPSNAKIMADHLKVEFDTLFKFK